MTLFCVNNVLNVRATFCLRLEVAVFRWLAVSVVYGAIVFLEFRISARPSGFDAIMSFDIFLMI